ncbi:Protein of unknown function [Gryllus bimaculatus]|nr:Protein of unknown function [Gryllus bimaculatus]
MVGRRDGRTGGEARRGQVGLADGTDSTRKWGQAEHVDGTGMWLLILLLSPTQTWLRRRGRNRLYVRSERFVQPTSVRVPIKSSYVDPTDLSLHLLGEYAQRRAASSARVAAKVNIPGDPDRRCRQCTAPDLATSGGASALLHAAPTDHYSLGGVGMERAAKIVTEIQVSFTSSS